MRLLNPRPVASPRAWLGLLLAVVLLLSGQEASAQIVHTKPAQVKAANRQALRDAHRTAAPYKDSHLDVKPARLKRGESTQTQRNEEGVEEVEVDYEPIAPAHAKPAGFLGLGRRNKPQPRPAAPPEKN